MCHWDSHREDIKSSGLVCLAQWLEPFAFDICLVKILVRLHPREGYSESHIFPDVSNGLEKGLMECQ